MYQNGFEYKSITKFGAACEHVCRILLSALVCDLPQHLCIHCTVCIGLSLAYGSLDEIFHKIFADKIDPWRRRNKSVVMLQLNFGDVDSTLTFVYSNSRITAKERRMLFGAFLGTFLLSFSSMFAHYNYAFLIVFCYR